MLTDNFSPESSPAPGSIDEDERDRVARSPQPQRLSTSSSRTAASALSYRSVSFLARLREAAPGTTSALDGLEALRQAAQRAKIPQAQSLPPSAYAAPLSPLRERDTVVLLEWFDRADMAEVESNLDRCLLTLWPEPCWEDDVTVLLKEFL